MAKKQNADFVDSVNEIIYEEMELQSNTHSEIGGLATYSDDEDGEEVMQLMGKADFDIGMMVGASPKDLLVDLMYGSEISGHVKISY